MIDGLKPYLEYKDSGLPWAEKMPSSWQLIPNRGLIRKRKVLVGKNHTRHQLLSLTKQGVIVRDVASGKGKWSSDMGTSQEVRAGDFVFCLFDVPETPRTVGMSPHSGMITGAYTVFECLHPQRAKYFELFYLAMDDRKLLSPLYSGLRHTIPPSRFIGTKTPQPPPDEQTAIVRFLDYANRRIEHAIRAKKKLIALLNEQKQSIVHRAVTRGLNPKAAFKPSGLPWLGDIPKHWDVSRSKYVFREVDDRSATGQELRLSMCQKRGLIPSSEIEVKRLVSESAVGAKICEAGDLVLNRLKAHLGVFALASVRGLVSPDYTILRPAREICSRYFELIYRTHACRVELRKRAKGIVQGFWRLYTDDFYDIRVPVPPVPEQEKIVKQLDSDLATLNTALARTEREIGLLREYRTRLVADMVTGKLDVRAVKLPAETEIPAENVAPDELAEEIETEEAEA